MRGHGALNLPELKQVLLHLGYTPDREKLKAMFKDLSRDSVPPHPRGSESIARQVWRTIVFFNSFFKVVQYVGRIFAGP